jgi:hypothetical protein
MRTLTLTALALGAAACGGDGLHLEYQSTLWNETRGVVLYDGDTARGHAAMLDTTCEFDVESGMVIGDVDLPGDSEVVSDVFQSQVLARSVEGLHTIVNGQWFTSQDIALEGVVDAAYGDLGPVALTRAGGECAVVWTGTQAQLDIGSCGLQASLHADPNTGDAFLVDAGIVSRVSPDGLTELSTGELAAVNVSTGALFVADGGVLSSIDYQGAVRWSEEVGSILSLDDMGALGGAAVVTVDRELVLFGADGAVRDSVNLPQVGEVVVSNRGRDLGLVLPDQVNFFDVAEGNSPFKVYTNTPVENPFSD